MGLVRNVSDLRAVAVGVVSGTSSADFLDHQRIAHRMFGSVAAGLEAVDAGEIDALVYDRPLLSWAVRGKFPTLQVLSVTFARQNYAFALAPDNALRIPLDVALLESVSSEWWPELVYRYLEDSASVERE